MTTTQMEQRAMKGLRSPALRSAFVRIMRGMERGSMDYRVINTTSIELRLEDDNHQTRPIVVEAHKGRLYLHDHLSLHCWSVHPDALCWNDLWVFDKECAA